MSEVKESKKTLIFTYGTLKRGFPNYHLIQDLIPTNDAVYHGNYITVDRLPLVLGPYGVPYLLNLPGCGLHQVHGELFSVSDKGLERLDELEGISVGHYERLPIRVQRGSGGGGGGDDGAAIVDVEAYYAHRTFAEEMWEKNKKEGFGVYTADMVLNYVKKDNRPQKRSVMEEITCFCSSG